ncbi:hypothetical protein [Lichenibacterium dinghuense]|uniref:hypothetical protein n=1 Tax=Lichenibacterium dinghuense TaxID=2895977 RepID=UPI001F35DD5C|nr:hypothetical protein [Lichenibacterium sp. 6Y81]
MNDAAWKFWGKRHGELSCFIVACGDREEAERRVANHDPFFEIIDAERVPDKVRALLDLEPGQVSGWSSMNMRAA